MPNKALPALILITLMLTACAGAQSAAATAYTPAQDALPASTRLILGTFRLEGTAEAVTAGQAAELLPLWQVYEELQASGTAAQEEMDALVQQIQETLSASQVQSIEAMGLTRADIMTVMAEQELVQGAPQAAAGSTVSAGGPEAGIPPGDMGGDPALMGGPAPVSVSGSSSDSTKSQTQADSGLPSALLDALIRLLETRLA